jgi:hypothetical protein
MFQLEVIINLFIGSVGGSETYWWFGVFMLLAAAINWTLLILTKFHEAGEDDLNKEHG